MNTTIVLALVCFALLALGLWLLSLPNTHRADQEAEQLSDKEQV